MRAYLIEKAGGEFKQVEMAVPDLGERDVLVRVVASGVNPLDLKIRAGQAGHAKQPLPAVLGLDMAGVVERGGGGCARV